MAMTQEDQESAFLSALESSMGRLQDALREALAAAGVRTPGPTAIGKAVGLDKSIAWKIGRMAKATSPLEAIGFLPGAAGGRIVVEAFTEGGVGSRLAKALQEAFDQVETDIETHAGTRRIAVAMARSLLDQDSAPSIDENLRRDHFRTSSAIWGAQARCQLKVDVVAPSDREGVLHIISIEGVTGLVRLRPEVAWRIARKSLAHDEKMLTPSYEPLDPAADQGEAPLFLRHCSSPAPPLEINEDAGGFLNFELPPGPIGRSGSLDCIVATAFPYAIRRSPSEPKVEIIGGVHVRTPCELLVHELLVHRSLEEASPPVVELYGQLMMGAQETSSIDRRPMPIPLSIERPRGAARALVIHELAGHEELVLDALALASQRFGEEHWQPRDFDVHRSRLSYPPIPTISTLVTERR